MVKAIRNDCGNRSPLPSSLAGRVDGVRQDDGGVGRSLRGDRHRM